MIKFKESGVDWIGEIPENWEIDRIKNVLKERIEKNDPIKTENILSLTNDRGVIPYSEKGAVGNNSKEDITGYKLAYPGDIVLNSMNVVIGSVDISQYFGAVSPVYYMLHTRNERQNIRYFNYLFKTQELQKYLKGFGNGILEIRMRIPMINLNSVKIPVPSLEEQNKIVEFLDNKCSQIDKLIKLQKDEIENLEKYKRNFIGEQFNPSNCNLESYDLEEWFYNVPKNWNVCKIKNVATTSSGGTPTSSEPLYYDGNINWICSYDLHEKEIFESERKITELGMKNCAGTLQPVNSVLVAMYGGGGTIGNSGILKCEAVTNQAVCSIVFNNQRVNPMFGFYQIRYLRPYFMKYAVGTRKDPNISQEIIANMQFVVPSLEEQNKIVSVINEKIETIEKLKQTKLEKIKVLEDYKNSLIYEVLTGKKEI